MVGGMGIHNNCSYKNLKLGRLETAWCPDETLYRLVLEVVARLEDRGVHLLHRVPELDAEAAEDVALPGVVFRRPECGATYVLSLPSMPPSVRRSSAAGTRFSIMHMFCWVIRRVSMRILQERQDRTS